MFKVFKMVRQKLRDFAYRNSGSMKFPLPVSLDLAHKDDSGFWPFASEYWEASDIGFEEPETGIALHRAKYYPSGDKIDLVLNYGLEQSARRGGRACG